jgi:hypothetical protein
MPPNSETSANRRVISNQGAHQVMRFIHRRVSSAIALYWPAHSIKQSDSSGKLMSQSACDAQPCDAPSRVMGNQCDVSPDLSLAAA